jgi:hypothetical protein
LQGWKSELVALPGRSLRGGEEEEKAEMVSGLPRNKFWVKVDMLSTY